MNVTQPGVSDIVAHNKGNCSVVLQFPLVVVVFVGQAPAYKAKGIYLAIVVLMLLGVAVDVRIARESHIEYVVTERHPAKGWRVEFAGRITIENLSSVPRWYVWNVKPMAATAVLNTRIVPTPPLPKAPSPFHVESQAGVVVVSNWHTDVFSAILLPPGGKMTSEYFTFCVSASSRFVDVYQVGEMLVDGITPLENWLPFSVVSARRSHISRKRRKLKHVSYDYEENGGQYLKPPATLKACEVQRIRIKLPAPPKTLF